MKTEIKPENLPVSASPEDGQKAPILTTLLDDLQEFCRARRGRVAELAAALGVVQPQLSAWLTRRKEPAGEVTLRMQAWLSREREAEKAGLAERIAAAPPRLAAALKFQPRSIETYLAAGQREFSRQACRIAELEEAADLEPGSLARSMLGGLFDQHNNDAGEWASYLSSGWDGLNEPELESMIGPLCEKWRKEELAAR